LFPSVIITRLGKKENQVQFRMEKWEEGRAETLQGSCCILLENKEGHAPTYFGTLRMFNKTMLSLPQWGREKDWIHHVACSRGQLECC
jgi:hypothetical protein